MFEQALMHADYPVRCLAPVQDVSPRGGWAVFSAQLRVAMSAPVPVWAQTAATARGAASGGYAGFGGTRWTTDYGIGSGRCDRDAIVVPAGCRVPKTLVQRHEENLKNRTVGIIGATASSGLLLSTRLHGQFDERDRRCLGHVLELGTAGRQVGWTNGATRQAYAVAVTEYTPSTVVPSGARPAVRDRCRVLLLTTSPAGTTGAARRGRTETLIACQANPGVWSIR